MSLCQQCLVIQVVNTLYTSRSLSSIVQLPNKVNKGKSCAPAGEKRIPYYYSCVVLLKEEKLLSATHSPRKPQNDDALEDIMNIFFSFSFNNSIKKYSFVIAAGYSLRLVNDIFYDAQHVRFQANK